MNVYVGQLEYYETAAGLTIRCRFQACDTLLLLVEDMRIRRWGRIPSEYPALPIRTAPVQDCYEL